MAKETIIKTAPSKVSELLAIKLKIPAYQRPYKWQSKHVEQLIDDIIHHQRKPCYRLGTVVLHKKENCETYDIVDGQQRLLTLTLLCHELDTSNSTNQFTLLGHDFESSISISNLKHNAQLISDRLSDMAVQDRQALLEFILDKCELVQVELDDLSEAFQFFDSQNARGKLLEPHDLLKAYHLRAMMNSTNEKERRHHVSVWEQGINPKDSDSIKLATMMGDYLFRLRRWLDGENGHWFSRHFIDVFKGVDLADSIFPFMKPMLAQDFAVETYSIKPARHSDTQSMAYPFQVNQLMLNGTRFFEYLQHYMAMYMKLFVGKDALLHDFVEKTNYDGSHRVGDGYVRTLFFCTVLYYYDKFGENELDKAASLCYRWCYYLRLKNTRVSIATINNHAVEANSLLKAITKAMHPSQVLRFVPISIEINFTGWGSEEIQKFMGIRQSGDKNE